MGQQFHSRPLGPKYGIADSILWKQSLSKRYPVKQKHHSFEDWDEYSIIQLPPETSDHTRLLIERVVIAIGAKMFPNELTKEPPVSNTIIGLKLKNRKK